MSSALEKALTALGAVRVAGTLKSHGVKDTGKMMFEGVTSKLPETFTAVNTHRMADDLSEMKGEMSETNELLREFLMRHGRTPKGIISIDGITTANPMPDSGEILFDNFSLEQ